VSGIGPSSGLNLPGWVMLALVGAVTVFVAAVLVIVKLVVEAV
jgi:hypothetical protein